MAVTRSKTALTRQAVTNRCTARQAALAASKIKRTTKQADRQFLHMVAIDTESKNFEDRRVSSPPYILVWEISVIPLTEDLKVKRNQIFTTLMRPSYLEVHKTKLPKRIGPQKWKTANRLYEKSFQEKLFKKLDKKFWIGWNISRADVKILGRYSHKLILPNP